VPFRCPACAADALAIGASLELPPDTRSDEITLQLVACARCGFRGVAVYEESRRGGMSDEAVDHTVRDVEPSEVDRLAASIGACPEPRRATCACAAHRALGAPDARGRWSLGRVARLRSPAVWPMQRAS